MYEMNMTMCKLAKITGLDVSCISLILNKKRNGYFTTYEKIAKALKCNVQDLFDEDITYEIEESIKRKGIDASIVADNLNRIIREKNMSMYKLCKTYKLNYNTVDAMYKGIHKHIQLSTLYALSEKLGYPYEYLMTEH